jgi:glutaconate CoA-transferase subunit A
MMSAMRRRRNRCGRPGPRQGPPPRAGYGWVSHYFTGRGGPDRRSATSAHLTLPVRSRKYGPATETLNRMARISTLAEAIEATVRDGDTLAVEGFTHLIPYAAGHEIIRQRRKGLTLIRMTPDLVYDQLIGMGCVDKLIFSWGGNPGVGSLHRFRDAVENGWPQRLGLEEHSHAAMANAYEAGAAGLPCAMFRGYIGGDLPKVNAKIKRVTCPFTGEELAAVPAHRPDVAVIHAQRADKAGNVMIEGVLGVQKEAVLASKRSVVTVEEIVDDLGPRSPNATVLPHWTVGHMAEVPGGAFPSYAQGYYPRTNSFYKQWDAISRERDSFLAWMKENVLEKGPEVFAEHVRKYRTAAE